MKIIDGKKETAAQAEACGEICDIIKNKKRKLDPPILE
jgi:hypothetical protein